MKIKRLVPAYYSFRMFFVANFLNFMLVFPILILIMFKTWPELIGFEMFKESQKEINIKNETKKKKAARKEFRDSLLLNEEKKHNLLISAKIETDSNKNNLQVGMEINNIHNPFMEEIMPRLNGMLIISLLVFLWFNHKIRKYFILKCKGKPIPEKVKKYTRKYILYSPLVNSLIIVFPYIITFLAIWSFYQGNEGANKAQYITIYFDIAVIAAILTLIFVYLWQRSRLQNFYLQHVFSSDELRKSIYPYKKGKLQYRILLVTITTTVLPLGVVLFYIFYSISTVDIEFFKSLPDSQQLFILGDFFKHIPYKEHMPDDMPLFIIKVVDTFQMVVGISIGIFVTLIYSVLFNSWSKKDLVYPLHELLDNMRKTGEGVTNAYSIVRSNDEIGELTEGYNEMVTKIQKYLSEVKKMNEELEDKVKVRTKEIEQQKEEIEAQRDSLKELNEELEQQKFELETTLENLKTAQDQLVEAEKMASLGNLVAGIAHELNTPVGIGVQGVSGIVNRTNNIIQLMESNKMKKSDLDSYLKYINESGKLAMSNLLRTSDLIKGFKQVSVDQSTEEKRKFALKNYMQDVINTIYPKFKKRKIEVIVNCDEKLQVESYPGAIAQILTNLIINSLNHAFSENDEGKIEIIIETGEKGVKLIYKDNGKGMNEEVKSKIFDPFFTTNKKVGTGLGMHIVYNLVTQKLFGDIKCKSAPGKGVEFTISLPQLKNKK